MHAKVVVDKSASFINITMDGDREDPKSHPRVDYPVTNSSTEGKRGHAEMFMGNA
jgi:hypothetical protein